MGRRIRQPNRAPRAPSDRVLGYPSTACLLLLLTNACSHRELFVPAEHATGLTPHGYRAAEYEVQDAEDSVGDVKIWSKGTLRKNLRGSKETFVHVAFSIDNQTHHTMRLEPYAG